MSQRKVAPRTGAAEKVRPAPVMPEPEQPKAPPGFAPETYVKMLDRLRLDIKFGELDCESEALDSLQRCRGWDVLAGEIVAKGLRERRVEPWQLVGVLVVIAEQLAEEYTEVRDDKARALMLLAAARWVRAEWSRPVGFGVEMLVSLVGNEWGGSPLVRLALAVLDFFPEAMPESDGYSIDRIEHLTRCYIRAVFDHAGLAAALNAISKIKSYIENGARPSW